MMPSKQLPKIYRHWYGTYGRFFWAVKPLESHWGIPPPIHLRRLHEKAWRWCHQQNDKELRHE